SRPAPRQHAGGEADLVELDPDHPGFRDLAYRERRNRIARLALDYRAGDPPPIAPYTADEHAVWRAVWAELGPLHDRWACTAYRRCGERLAMDRTRIPQFIDLNPRLRTATGFGLLPVAGLVSARRFLEYLADGVFLATQYIRHHSRPLYTPEPDVVHELVGHAAMFMDATYARISRAFGRAARGASDERVTALERIYWYTLEFGLVREGGGIKACGAGLLSGAGELARFAGSAELRPFDLSAMAALPYDPTGYQPVLFVADSFAQIESLGERLATI
ncbi:MAG TPA: hypothetical protein VM070_01110, partial [Candidatus Saccharimonadales bacterium]|nr:hypothetical protein [Candidatus Saccharimonadales bacterium]